MVHTLCKRLVHSLANVRRLYSPVDHSVVEVEQWIRRRRVEVHHGTTNLPVATTMNTKLVSVTVVALQAPLEILEVYVLEDNFSDVLPSIVVVGEPRVDVTLETTGVVLEG